MQKPTTIITGASGYLGGCVTRKFTQEGWETVSMTRRIVPQMRTIAFRLGELVEPAALVQIPLRPGKAGYGSNSPRTRGAHSPSWAHLQQYTGRNVWPVKAAGRTFENHPADRRRLATAIPCAGS